MQHRFCEVSPGVIALVSVAIYIVFTRQTFILKLILLTLSLKDHFSCQMPSIPKNNVHYRTSSK